MILGLILNRLSFNKKSYKYKSSLFQRKNTRPSSWPIVLSTIQSSHINLNYVRILQVSSSLLSLREDRKVRNFSRKIFKCKRLNYVPEVNVYKFRAEELIN